ncbi:unnamed protein product [Urochloa humidicola]
MPRAPPARARPTIPSALLQTQLPPPLASPTDEEIDADTAACGRICLESEFEPGKHLHQTNGGFFAAKKKSSRRRLLLHRLLLSALRIWLLADPSALASRHNRGRRTRKQGNREEEGRYKQKWIGRDPGSVANIKMADNLYGQAT